MRASVNVFLNGFILFIGFSIIYVSFSDNVILVNNLVSGVSIASVCISIADLICSKIEKDEFERLGLHDGYLRATDMSKDTFNNMYKKYAPRIEKNLKHIFDEEEIKIILSLESSEIQKKEFVNRVEASSIESKETLIYLINNNFDESDVEDVDSLLNIEYEEQEVQGMIEQGKKEEKRSYFVAEVIVSAGIFMLLFILAFQEPYGKYFTKYNNTLTLFAFFIILITWYVKANYRAKEIDSIREFSRQLDELEEE